jgi:hypothetical protein
LIIATLQLAPTSSRFAFGLSDFEAEKCEKAVLAANLGSAIKLT